MYLSNFVRTDFALTPLLSGAHGELLVAVWSQVPGENGGEGKVVGDKGEKGERREGCEGCEPDAQSETEQTEQAEQRPREENEAKDVNEVDQSIDVKNEKDAKDSMDAKAEPPTATSPLGTIAAPPPSNPVPKTPVATGSLTDRAVKLGEFTSFVCRMWISESERS